MHSNTSAGESHVTGAGGALSTATSNLNRTTRKSNDVSGREGNVSTRRGNNSVPAGRSRAGIELYRATLSTHGLRCTRGNAPRAASAEATCTAGQCHRAAVASGGGAKDVAACAVGSFFFVP